MLSILYVDDDEALLELGKAFLEQSGSMQVEVFCSATHALTLIESVRYDAIVSDYEMPEMNGIGFLQYLRQKGNTTPFLIFTGRGREDVAIEAFHSGVDYYVQKGGEVKSQFAELIHKIKKAVERKRTTAALEHSNSLLLATLEATADGILVVDPGGQITACNHKFLHMWNIPESPGSVKDDKKLLCFVLDQVENPKEYLNTVEEIYSRPESTSYDFIRCRDGRVFRRYSQAQKIGQEVVGRVWSFRDITLQDKAECELRAACEQLAAAEEELKEQYTELGRQVALLKESEEKYRGVFDADSDPLLVVDRETSMLSDLNTAACRVYGYTRGEMLRLTLRDLVHEPMQGGNSGDGENRFYVPYHRKKDGTIFPVGLSSASLILQGRPVLILSVRDVTPTKMIEDSLKLTNIRLNLLLGVTRHDILNKLTVLSSCTEILSTRMNDTGSQDILKLQARAMEEIKNHIDFTKEYDSLGIKGPVWQSVEEIASRSFAQFLKTISFRCEIHGLEIYADPMMEKVFYNLFDNAFRYGEGISEITLSCTRRGTDIIIIFRDDGAGIPAAEKEWIFQRGYGKNTGLGLFLTREILSITGMGIHETGEYRKGAQFEILVPGGYFRFGNPGNCPIEYCQSTGILPGNECCEKN